MSESGRELTLRAGVEGQAWFNGGGWDMGVTFRQTDANREFRLVVRGDGLWSLNDRRDNTDTFIHEGDVRRFLDLRAGGQHKMTVIAMGRNILPSRPVNARIGT